MSSSRKNVIIADPHPILQEALKSALEQTGEFEVVSTVTNSDQVFFEAMERTPDLVIMEIELAGREATSVAENIIHRLPST